MKKNGFTLIELIVTIALIGLIGVVLSVNMLNILNDQDDKKYDEFVEIITDTACAYATLSTSECDKNSNYCKINGKTLIEEGMIEEEINGFKVANAVVGVHYDNNGQRICELKEYE